MSESPVANIIKKLLDSSKEDRRDWLKQGDEIDRYTTSDDYGFLYQEFDHDLSFKARVNKASEFRQILGPYLYPQNPDAAVNSEEWADEWAKKRHVIEERYADYSARHGELAVHMRRCIDQALTYGRGMTWCGFNQRKGIVQHVFDTVDNLLTDPDAKNEEEKNWQARTRVKPRWELRQRYPDAADIIDRLPAYQKDAKEGRQHNGQSDTDLVSYNEVWMGVAPENYSRNMEPVQGDKLDLGAKRKYCIADGKILHTGPWEIPFFMIDEWPGSALDLLERPGSLYPLPPMEPGMGHLRAMNYFYTLFISKYKLMSRTPFARMIINGQGIELDQLHKILRGEQLDILTVKVNGNENVKISDLFQRIDWGDPVPGFERGWGLLASEFEKSVGLYEILYTGQTQTQLRSATAANLIENKSSSRIDAMRECTVKYLQKLYRKTLFAARYLHGSDDINKLFGASAGPLWGELGPPEVIAQEQQVRQQLMQQAAAMGMPPEQADAQLGPPQFVSMDAWITEADRTVDGGSMRRLDINAQVDNLNVALNQLGPAVVNLPGGGKFVAALAAEFSKINRFSPELQEAAKNIAVEIELAQSMAMAPPTQTAPNPPAGPMSGPMGGAPQ
jgi:hypothetical protein